MGAGATLGISWVAWRSAEIERLQLINASLWALFGAFVGGRFAYVAVNWAFYRQHLLDIFQVFKGGLAWSGALAGGLVIVAIYAWRSRKPVGELLWALFPMLTSIIVLAWLACWIDGCAYGPLVFGNLGLTAMDEMGNRLLRFPTQLFGASAALLWFIVLDVQSARFSRPRITGWIGLLGLALILFGSIFLRADPGIFQYGMRLDAWAALGFAAIAVVGVLASWH